MASGSSACVCPPCRPGRAGTATGTCRLARVRRTMSRVSSPLAYPQVLRNLARLVTQQISLGDSKALIRRRLATREERFLRFVARYIYGYPRSPYLPLLAHAGAELGDLQTMVRRRGLEGTLGGRLAGLAQKGKESLQAVRLLVGSEPLTPGKAEEIRRTGAVVGTMYVFSEGGAVGIACGNPLAPDDMHFAADCYAMILRRRPMPGVGELAAYMFTPLLDSAPKIMLNVESDDFGEFTPRRCGCVFDELGLGHHFAYVRSFTKLTGEGATLLGTDCVRILEEVLPREFGGRSIDYQLLETEDEDHLTRLFLAISPEVGPLDEQKVLARFVEALHHSQPRGAISPLG